MIILRTLIVAACIGLSGCASCSSFGNAADSFISNIGSWPGGDTGPCL